MRRGVLVGAVSLGLVVSGFLPRTVAAQRFQGLIRFTAHDENGKTTEITQLAAPGKSSFMVVEQGKAPGGMIVDSSAGTVTFVNGEDKSYSVLNLAMMQGMMQGMAGMMKNMPHNQNDASGDAHQDKPTGTLSATGRSETVAGVRCQVYAYDGTDEGKHETGEVCLAKGAGMMVGGETPQLFPGMMGQRMHASMQQRLAAWGPLGAMLAQGYGIMKGTNYENGKLKGSMEVTAFQPGVPSAAAFQPPAGYKAKSMSDMMGH
jgi:Domain of unknown function (DUF4412)